MKKSEHPLGDNPEAIEIYEAMARTIVGGKAESVMAALTCISGRTLAALAIPPDEFGKCLGLYVKQVADHYRFAVEQGVGQ